MKNLDFEDYHETKKFQYPVQLDGVISASNYLEEYYWPNTNTFAYILRNGKEFTTLESAKIALGVNKDNIIIRN